MRLFFGLRRYLHDCNCLRGSDIVLPLFWLCVYIFVVALFNAYRVGCAVCIVACSRIRWSSHPGRHEFGHTCNHPPSHGQSAVLVCMLGWCVVGLGLAICHAVSGDMCGSVVGVGVVASVDAQGNGNAGCMVDCICHAPCVWHVFCLMLHFSAIVVGCFPARTWPICRLASNWVWTVFISTLERTLYCVSIRNGDGQAAPERNICFDGMLSTLYAARVPTQLASDRLLVERECLSYGRGLPMLNATGDEHRDMHVSTGEGSTAGDELLHRRSGVPGVNAHGHIVPVVASCLFSLITWLRLGPRAVVSLSTQRGTVPSSLDDVAFVLPIVIAFVLSHGVGGIQLRFLLSIG